MIAERWIRRDPDDRPELHVVDTDRVREVPCLNCRLMISSAARYCRRCGTRQPMAAPPAAEAPAAIEAAPAEPESLPPPLVPLWSPFDRPADPALTAPATFRSFAAGSEWAPRATEDEPTDEAVTAATTATVAPIGRCTHKRPRQSTAICAICGGLPGARIVTARVDGSGTVPEEMSARETLSPAQRGYAVLGAFAFVAVLGVAPLATLIGLIALATLAYAAILAFRVRIFAVAMDRPDMISVSDAEARSIPPSKLPIYTVLVAAFREPEVIGRLVESLQSLEYPVHKLDIKLLLEQDDPETLEAAMAANPGAHIELVRVPPLGPRTKPKALMVGMARARGQYVTIYDAEDQPDPLQLRRAIVAFRRDPSLACLQAKLSYRNATQNLITMWFSAEYAMWFRQFLPGLSRLRVPLPLGGTSNHFRRRLLTEVGGWDPYNVTEDADLGIRLARAGYRTAVLDSTTEEEANSDFVNWAKQRSRWYKGYLQTWLIHMRDPRRLWRELGPRGFVGFNLFVGGTPLVAILNPVFWALTAVWFLARPDVIQSLFPFWLYYAGLFCLVVGNFLYLYGSVVSARMTGRPEIVLAALLSPVYWVMMSIAALKAAIQLVHAPSFWEKTTHGLDRDVLARLRTRGQTS